jgi:hypothetical protein
MLAVLGETMKSRDITAGRKPEPFTAAAVAAALNASSTGLDFNSTDMNVAVVKEVLFPNQPSTMTITPKAVAKRLKAHLGAPAKHGGKTLVLKSFMDKHERVIRYHVTSI